MHMVRKCDELERLAFAERAAKWFAEHPEHSTFSDSRIQPGCFLAIRWGLGEDCVVVVKLDEYEPVFNYQELVREYRGIR